MSPRKNAHLNLWREKIQAGGAICFSTLFPRLIPSASIKSQADFDESNTITAFRLERFLSEACAAKTVENNFRICIACSISVTAFVVTETWYVSRCPSPARIPISSANSTLRVGFLTFFNVTNSVPRERWVFKERNPPNLLPSGVPGFPCRRTRARPPRRPALDFASFLITSHDSVFRVLIH